MTIAYVAPAPTPVAQPAPGTTFAQAFAASEPAGSGIRYVSNPVVQELPMRAAPAASRVAAASPQRRMAPAAAPAPVASDKAAATHLVQLGSYSSKLEAERGWNVLKAKFPQLKDHKPVITEAVVNGRNFWRVAAAGFGPKSAQSMCGTVKSSGRGCFAYAASAPPAGAVKRDVQMASRSR